MNILLESRAFYPSVGGLEMMGRELAAGWKKRGHQVRVVTVTPLEGKPELSEIEVVRRPSLGTRWELLQWCHVFFQNGVSLKGLGPALFSRRPIVYRHPDILEPGEGHLGLRNLLKRYATYLGHNVVTSTPVADSVPGPKTRIPNTYRPTFRNASGRDDAERDGLLFVGRLVSVKGTDLALDALARLHAEGKSVSLTLCGDGPDREQLEQQARALGVREHVYFAGWTVPEELAQYYGRAEVALVPSRYEPFGIVALEAVACGCPVVAARTGGLPEAVGPCGLLFAPGDAGDLARQVRRARTPAVRDRLRGAMPEHIARHDVDSIAGRYLEVLEKATGGS